MILLVLKFDLKLQCQLFLIQPNCLNVIKHSYLYSRLFLNLNFIAETHFEILHFEFKRFCVWITYIQYCYDFLIIFSHSERQIRYLKLFLHKIFPTKKQILKNSPKNYWSSNRATPFFSIKGTYQIPELFNSPKKKVQVRFISKNLYTLGLSNAIDLTYSMSQKL
ncbi:hypothetical protein BpHYR1_004983 [Brachionus plicatilis]|uniref:Uncharacterized protein n=1 Tax=Brachionus plicatilis TaxID=10195 RepID=A0A3M7S364_BRAPC|nr:hypothetical protein BpHYR1_004983 [Brachionus plicatilis]